MTQHKTTTTKINKIKQLTEEQAITLGKSGACEEWSDVEIARMQLWQKRLFVEMYQFQNAINNLIDDNLIDDNLIEGPLSAYDLVVHKDMLKDLFKRKYGAPTYQELMDLIPEHVKKKMFE